MTIIDTYPAYTIIAASNEYAPGEQFAIGRDTPRHGRLYTFYKVGSVAAYAAQYDEDVDAAIADAKERGDQLYWANPQGAIITAHKQAHKIVRGISHGDEITVDGKRFRVEPANNNNVKLVELA
jgi:hypothetical protein